MLSQFEKARQFLLEDLIAFCQVKCSIATKILQLDVQLPIPINLFGTSSEYHQVRSTSELSVKNIFTELMEIGRKNRS